MKFKNENIKKRLIVHVDMDAFYASVEQRDNPAYRGKPVIVGANPKDGKSRGVVSTCSYEARRFGVSSAMPVYEALKKCPSAIFVLPAMKKYLAVSKIINDVFHSFTPLVEPLSIDEAFLDITGVVHLFPSKKDLCLKIKAAIKKATCLSCSLGVSSTKMVSKIASDINKPNGFLIVENNEVLNFLKPLPVSVIYGIGKKTIKRFHSLGIFTIKQLQSLSLNQLNNLFGNCGEYYWNAARGIDCRDVETNLPVKSVSNEFTFNEDTDLQCVLNATLMHLAEKVAYRLRSAGLRGRTISIRVRISDFRTFTRSITIKSPTNLISDIYAYSVALMKEFLENKIRLIGVKVSNFNVNDLQTDFIEDKKYCKTERLNSALEQINKRYGTDAIFHAIKSQADFF